MSLRTPPVQKVFDTLTAASVNVAGGVISIEGLPDIVAANVVAASCERTCPSACVKQVVTITPTIPASTCDCPWLWALTIKNEWCNTRQPLPNDVWSNPRVYEVGDPDTVLTVAIIVAQMVAMINDDPSSSVVATAVGSTAFILQEKDCDGPEATCGFTATVNSGAVALTGATGGTPANNLAHVNPVLNATEIARTFPLLPVHSFTRPTMPYCGTYCVYRFTVRPQTQPRDPHMHDAYVDREMNVEIWVNNTLANLITDWDTPLVGALACLGTALE